MSAVEWQAIGASAAPSTTPGMRTLGRRYRSRPVGSRHTIAETWMPTSTARRIRRGGDGHEVSKKVIRASWNAERIGPRIIAAPQRGHAHVRLL